MKHYARVILISATLSTASPAQATGIADIFNFAQQLGGWLSTIQKLAKMPEDLFNQIDYKDLAMRIGGSMIDSGLKMAGIDLNAILGPILNNAAAFQKKIEDIRADILKQTKKFTSLAFLDNFDKGTVMEGRIGLSPELQQLRINAALELAAANDMTGRNVKDMGTASQVVEEAKKGVTDSAKHAEETNKNAEALANEAPQIQSTREGVQLLVRAQAEAIMNQAYQTTAITNQISQMTRETQVSNNMLSEMIKQIVAERKDIAQDGINTIRLQQKEGAAMAENARDSIATAAEGIEQTIEVKPSDIKINGFY